MKQRIQYKALLLTYKVIHKLAPRYLEDLVRPYQQERNLRSANQHLLEVPSTRLKTFGDRAFSVYAPRLWNAMPIHVKQAPSLALFKKMLKEHLFKYYYC